VAVTFQVGCHFFSGQHYLPCNLLLHLLHCIITSLYADCLKHQKVMADNGVNLHVDAQDIFHFVIILHIIHYQAVLYLDHTLFVWMLL